jgi:hypothetical protein
VIVNIDAAEIAAVKAGDRVAITLPDGQSTTGVVTRIGTAATGGSGISTVPVSVALAHPSAAGGIDQAQVQARITTATVRHTLAVPATALVSLGHGRYAVETPGARGAHRVMPVTVGLFDDAQGLVQVTSPTLTAGQPILLPTGATAYAAIIGARRRPPIPVRAAVAHGGTDVGG